jgi:TetR/AcrR family transcriptional regulator, regulator of cefoperazone and chloramphenicol sensitivity
MARTAGSSAGTTRARIVAAAMAQFARKTYAGTSLRDIAESIGLTKAALYYHFPSKEALLDAMFAPTIERFGRLVADATGNDGTVDRRLLVERLVDVQAEQVLAVRALAGDPSIAHALRDQFRFEQTISGIADALVDPAAPPGPTASMRARCAVAAVNGSLMMTAREQDLAARPGADCRAKVLSVEQRQVIIDAALAVLGI